MTLYAIAEDWDNGDSWEDHMWHDNQLIGIFVDKDTAFNNLRTSVEDYWIEDKVSVFGKYVITYHYENERLYRRLVEVKTDEMHPNIYSDSILNQNI